MWTLNLEGLFRTPLKYAIYDEIPLYFDESKIWYTRYIHVTGGKMCQFNVTQENVKRSTLCSRLCKSSK